MFTTFYGMNPSAAGRDDAGSTSTSAAAPRPKRSQVRRACDWCKLLRIKCDNHRPCSHCRQADHECKISGENQFRSMAEAVNEVKRLRAQVRAFESTKQTSPAPASASAPAVVEGEPQHLQPPQHLQQPQQLQPVQQQLQQPQQPQLQSLQRLQRQPEKQQHTPPTEQDQQQQQDQDQAGDQQGQHSEREHQKKTPVALPSPAPTPETSLYASNGPRTDKPSPSSAARNGVWVDSIPYGITSMPFYLSRMDQFLQTVSRRPQLDSDLEVFARPATSSSGTHSHRPPVQLANCVYPQQDTVKSSANDFLSRSQENLFLDLFWQTHYFSFPILNEGQFRREYKALWDDSPGPGPRKPSPLVDIVIALCIQLGGFLVRQRSQGSDPSSRSPQDQRQSPHDNNPSLGGFQYYRRCQDAIDQITESPSIYTVQCFIFSIVYLYEAGLVNSAHVVAGKAIMMAMILGLPNEPQADEPEPQKEVARRTWWSLYILDAKLAMEVARPPMIGPSHSTCQLPSDSNDVARWLGPHYSFDDSCPTWLGFQTQTLRLLDAVLSVRSVFFTKYDSIVGVNGYKDFVNNATAREECAFLLTERMKDLNAWAKQVPAGYLVARQHGPSFSTNRTPLMFEAEMIIHCQRQRMLLELQYHEYCMSLYRPFICFASSADESTPVSDAKAAAALAHAMTLTSMIHQTLTSTEVLSGIYHVFRWQKNALFTMLGFAYTFPINGSATATRNSIDMAIAVIEIYRDVLPEAGPVAVIGRALSEHVGAVIMDIGAGGSSWSSLPSTSSAVAPVAPSRTTPDAQAVVAVVSDAQTVAPNFPVAVAGPVPLQQDWNMMDMTIMPPPMDKMLSQGTLNQISEEIANIDTMDILWPGLVSGDVPNADWSMFMGDSIG